MTSEQRYLVYESTRLDREIKKVEKKDQEFAKTDEQDQEMCRIYGDESWKNRKRLNKLRLAKKKCHKPINYQKSPNRYLTIQARRRAGDFHPTLSEKNKRIMVQNGIRG